MELTKNFDTNYILAIARRPKPTTPKPGITFDFLQTITSNISYLINQMTST